MEECHQPSFTALGVLRGEETGTADGDMASRRGTPGEERREATGWNELSEEDWGPKSGGSN